MRRRDANRNKKVTTRHDGDEREGLMYHHCEERALHHDRGGETCLALLGGEARRRRTT